MYDRLIKSGIGIQYREWTEKNNYSILSSRHRGFYAEMIFKIFCQEKNIMAFRINPHIGVMAQISANFLTKKQQKILKKIERVELDFFCVENGKGYFVALKMGTSNLSLKQREVIKDLGNIKIFLFRVFEDAEVLIKKIN